MSRRLGYAMAKDAADARALADELTSLGCTHVFIDLPKSDRMERADLFSPSNIRGGETIVLVDRKHLGRGREAERFLKIADELGVGEIVERKPDKPEPRKPGPAPEFQPDEKQERTIRHYWHGPFKRAVALAKAGQVMGYPVHAATLNRHLGPRSKPGAWINKPPKGGKD